MKLKLFAVAAVAAFLGLVGAGRTYAHHSFAATYFVDQSVSIDGTLKEFLFRNPHSFVKVDVKDDARHPFYAWAEEKLGTPAVPVWNFHKILIGRDGAAVS